MDDRALVGKTIAFVKISDNRESVLFITIDGDIICYMACGDCCSQSWIEHFDYGSLIGATVIDVICKYPNEDLDAEREDHLLPTRFPDFQQEYDQAYFYEIVTDKGSETLEMRNSSNGYYGGYMERW